MATESRQVQRLPPPSFNSNRMKTKMKENVEIEEVGEDVGDKRTAKIKGMRKGGCQKYCSFQ